jgi:bifunctional DNase/RNase
MELQSGLSSVELQKMSRVTPRLRNALITGRLAAHSRRPSTADAAKFSVGHAMNKSVVEVQVRAVLPFNSGRAVFVGNDEKVFVIYVDESVGAANTMFMNNTPKERPLTHDLMAHLMAAVGAKVDRVIINDLKSETYFARLIMTAENELFEKKIIELDGRPSDCLALAIQQHAPIYVSREVWEEVEDRSDVLKSLEEGGQQGEQET